MYKILIVDDESIEREALKYIIKNSHLEISEIREAVNGLEAIKVAAAFNPDIITLDIKMPGLNGIEAGHVLKGINPNLKIIFVTAYDNFDYAHEAIKIGVEEFIIKPAEDEATIQILQTCIDELDRALDKKKEVEKLKMTMNQISGYLENEFVSSVVSGDIDEHQASDYLTFMVNEFDEGFGVVIEVDFVGEGNFNYVHRNMIKKRFAQQLTDLLDQQIKFMLNLVKNTIYILVFDYPKDKENVVKRLIEDEILMAGVDLETMMDVQLYYGFGQSYGEISMLWKSFAQARGAAKNMLLDIMEDCDTDQLNVSTLANKENDLCRCLLQGNKDEVVEQADYILNHLIFASDDINVVRLQLYEFFILLSRYLNREGRSKHSIPEDLFNDLKNIASRAEAKNYVHGYLFEILEEMNEQQHSKTTGLLDKAVAYIELHYHEGLVLEEVANEVGFSTYYFGKLFKKSFDVTFTEYLTNLRMEKAKAYLKDQTLTVKDVTYQVGYIDPNYFTRVFKKYEGITPSDYRSQFS